MTSARAYALSSVEDDEAAAIAARRFITAGIEDGVPFVAGFGVLVLAAVERRSGALAAAAGTLAQADEAIANGVRYFVPNVGLERARLCRAAVEPDQAEEHAHAVLVASVEMGFRRTTVLALEELAHLSASAGSAAEAARLLGACAKARQAGGLVPNTEERRWIDDTTAAIVALLGDGAGRSAWIPTRSPPSRRTVTASASSGSSGAMPTRTTALSSAGRTAGRSGPRSSTNSSAGTPKPPGCRPYGSTI